MRWGLLLMTENEFRDMLLYKVMTITEVCNEFNVSHKTVLMAIFKDRLIARQVEGGSTWLVLRSSAKKWFNEPKRKSQREKLEQQRNRKLQTLHEGHPTGG